VLEVGLLSCLVLSPDTLLNGRYQIVEPVGEGGMAIVYRAIDTRLGRTVAVKVLHPEFARDKPFLERFQQEAEFAASLGAHPNIVDIYDIGEDGDRRYIVMEFIEGRSLKDLIRERAPFGVAETFAIGRQVASALDFAHKRGLVHRDVKPQNILVTDDGVAKVTDFGIARSATTSQLTRTGMVLGTVHYFSPEQAQGKPAGPPSDIYSLGVILYEMLTGHLPFDAENAIGVAMQHIHNEPPSPWQFVPELPARAVATVMRALEKDPERRFRDAAELSSALQPPLAADAGQTTVVAPVPTPPPESTTVFRPVEAATPPATHPPPRRRPVRPAVAARPERDTQQVVASSSSNKILVWLAVFLALIIIGVLAFLVTRQAFGGSATPTSTPTVTPSPTPKPKKHKKTPTVAVIVPKVPTLTPTPIPPTSTPTPPPPTATPTPNPKPPTPTPTPKPKPPTPTPTPKPPTPTPTTPAATPTPTPKSFIIPTVGLTPTTKPIG
jgi:eukaryotic-like serine/threonine-protein kinase